MSIPSRITLYPGNDQWLHVDGVTDTDTGQLTSDAVVTATLYDAASNPVVGLSALVLAAVSNSPGSYKGQVQGSEFTPPVNSNYTIEFSINGQVGDLKIPVSVKVRKS